MGFPLNIAEFLRTPILKNICEWLLLIDTLAFCTNDKSLEGYELKTATHS